MSEQKTQTQTLDSSTLDTLFTLLSDHRRRTIIAVLAARDCEIPVHELQREIIAREQETSAATVSDADRHRIAVSLHHDQIPRLTETQFVDYDEHRKTVTSTPALERAAPVLSLVTEDEPVQSVLENR